MFSKSTKKAEIELLKRNTVDTILSSPPSYLMNIGMGVIISIIFLSILASIYIKIAETTEMKADIIIKENFHNIYLSDNLKIDDNKINSALLKSIYESPLTVCYGNSSYYVLSIRNQLFFLSYIRQNESIVLTDFFRIEDNSDEILAFIIIDSSYLKHFCLNDKIEISLDDFPSEKFGKLLFNIKEIKRINNTINSIIISGSKPSALSTNGSKINFAGTISGKINITLSEKTILTKIIDKISTLIN